MKKFYNNFIYWTFVIISLLAQLPLFIIKLVMILIVKIAETILFVEDELRKGIKRIVVGLIKRLSVKDWLDFGRMLKLVGVCGALSHTPQLSTFQKLSNFHSL